VRGQWVVIHIINSIRNYYIIVIHRIICTLYWWHIEYKSFDKLFSAQIQSGRVSARASGSECMCNFPLYIVYSIRVNVVMYTSCTVFPLQYNIFRTNVWDLTLSKLNGQTTVAHTDDDKHTSAGIRNSIAVAVVDIVPLI
jgi:hypothetical protein